MSVLIQGDQLRALLLGVRVQKASFTNPQTTSTAIFTVTGGNVFITSLTGEVTVLQGGTANSFNITYTPSGGSAADLCAATVCTDDAVGTLYSLTTGIAADLLSEQSPAGSEVPNVTFAHMLHQPILVRPGAVNLKASGSNTGSTKWTLTYIPLDDGASVAAA